MKVGVVSSFQAAHLVALGPYSGLFPAAGHHLRRAIGGGKIVDQQYQSGQAYWTS